MKGDLGQGPEDWGYLAGESGDERWGILDLAILRGLVTWITGRDPVTERRRRQLAKEQRENAEKYTALEKEAFDTLGRGRDSPRVPAREGGSDEPRKV